MYEAATVNSRFGFRAPSSITVVQEGEVEKHRIHDLILQADAKQQQLQDSIAARPRGGARDELISELIQSRLAISRAQMNAEAGVSEQMIEEQQEVIAWLWRILEHAGMTQAQVKTIRPCCFCLAFRQIIGWMKCW